MARLIGSSRVIYTHELMPYEAEGLLQIENGLRERIGRPADTFEELHNAESYGPALGTLTLSMTSRLPVEFERRRRTKASSGLAGESPFS